MAEIFISWNQQQIPKMKFQYLIRAEDFVITRLRIGHTKDTKSNI